jgi:FtsZ-binding cell division protein ZapB
MQDLLQKIGIPTAIATSISLLIVVVPLLFKIDERYAKQQSLEQEVSRLEKENNDLRRELALLSGFQQAMTTFIREGRIPPAPSASSAVRPETAVPPVPPGFATATPSIPKNWNELSEGLKSQSSRLEKAVK